VQGELEIAGRRLSIRHLDRIIYPETGTTKEELLDYYVRVADMMLPHLRDRLLHMHRYPEGVTGPRFWQKACPEHHPQWIPTAPVWSAEKRANIDFCVVNELPALLWAVNIGSLAAGTFLHASDSSGTDWCRDATGAAQGNQVRHLRHQRPISHRWRCCGGDL
jgi:bifunctional non-homologous end joining protein LigD